MIIANIIKTTCTLNFDLQSTLGMFLNNTDYLEVIFCYLAVKYFFKCHLFMLLNRKNKCQQIYTGMLAMNMYTKA